VTIDARALLPCPKCFPSGTAKRIPRTVAVDGVTFDVGRNEMSGSWVPTVPGRPQIINMILGVLKPNSDYLIEGLDIATHRSRLLGHQFRGRIRSAPGNLTCIKPTHLRPYYGSKTCQTGSTRFSSSLTLDRFRHIKFGVLSSGEQTRVSCQGYAQQPAPAPSRRTDSIPRSCGREDIRNKIRELADKARRRLVDLAQYVRGRRRLPSGALLSRGKLLLEGTRKPPPRARQEDTLRTVHNCGARTITLGPE